MDVFFSPMACSLASRMACYEAGATDARFIEIDYASKSTPEGEDYRQIYELGLVPAIRLNDGFLLTENAAVLQYIADAYPDAQLAPRDPRGRAKLQQWLCFVGTELHKALFNVAFDKRAPAGAAAHALQKQSSRLDYLNRYLQDREFLLDEFSVADAYLTTVLNWAVPARIDLKPWPAIQAYLQRMTKRPNVARAIADEYALYQAEAARHRGT